ncbi:MAG TPA: class I SAM-dependent methyltransferase [Frankiaceae bacterium]|nr:class I SAM-dependent methyltransferase [Frankiaceae bacterium]
MPTPGETKAGIAGVFDRAAETYDSIGIEYFTPFGRRLVDLVDLRPGERVLDAGCGRGAATFPAAEAVGPDGAVHAIDLAPGMVQRTAEEAEARGLGNVTVRVGDAEQPDLPAGTVLDAVLSAFAIFFLPDPVAAMRRYRALLRDDGRLGISRFPEQPPSAWVRAAGAVMRNLPGPRPGHGADTPFASNDRLEATLRDAGFTTARSVVEPFRTTFRDREHWWSFVWSQGQRAALENVPADRLDDLKRECFDLLAEEVRPDGSLVLTQYVSFTVARA